MGRRRILIWSLIAIIVALELIVAYLIVSLLGAP